MEKRNTKKFAHENVLRESEEAEGLDVRGYDFNKGVDWEKLIDSFKTTGIQATHLSYAIDTISCYSDTQRSTLYSQKAENHCLLAI